MTNPAAIAGAAEWRRKVKTGEIEAPWVRKRREKKTQNEQGALIFGDYTERIKNEKEELAALEKHKAYAAKSIALTGASLLRHEEISAAAKPIEESSGVYFLVSCGEVVYVGQSVQVMNRVQEHRALKTFDSVAYIPCKPEMLNKLESLYIHILRPKTNGKMPDQSMNAPIKLMELFG